MRENKTLADCSPPNEVKIRKYKAKLVEISHLVWNLKQVFLIASFKVLNLNDRKISVSPTLPYTFQRLCLIS